jgi:hypothetical protein
MQEYVPEIDEDIPLPSKASEAMLDMTPQEELEMRARTIKMLADLTGSPIQPTEQDEAEAHELARQMIEDPRVRPDYAKYPNEVMAYLAGMVAQTNCMLVDDLADFKLYVVNKLVYEVEHAKDARSRIAALTKLGEVDGVDAFKKRTETTITVKPMEEVERELLSVLDNIQYAVIGKDEEVEQIEVDEDDLEETSEGELSVEDN